LKANKKDDLECTYSTISKHLKSLFMETTRSPYQPIPLEYEITDLKKNWQGCQYSRKTSKIKAFSVFTTN